MTNDNNKEQEQEQAQRQRLNETLDRNRFEDVFGSEMRPDFIKSIDVELLPVVNAVQVAVGALHNPNNCEHMGELGRAAFDLHVYASKFLELVEQLGEMHTRLNHPEQLADYRAMVAARRLARVFEL